MLSVPSLTAGMALNLAKALFEGPPASKMACTLQVQGVLDCSLLLQQQDCRTAFKDHNLTSHSMVVQPAGGWVPYHYRCWVSAAGRWWLLDCVCHASQKYQS